MREVSEIIGMPQSTIRFWEKEFEQIKPKRSNHNQRFFTPDDIQTLRIIKFLIKEKGLKIDAAKAYLKDNKHNVSRKIEVIDNLTKIRNELEGLLKSLSLRAERSNLNI